MVIVRSTVLASLLGLACLTSMSIAAQDQSAAPSASTSAATFATPQGQLTVNTPPPPNDTTTPPPFAQLAGSSKTISEAAAAGYPPLANDFAYADANHDGQISRAEYQRWLKNRK